MASSTQGTYSPRGNAMHTPKPLDHILLPVIGCLSAGIVTFMVAGVVGFYPLELAIPFGGAVFGHFINTI
jgi:hypothetical protein